jgi:hypothetical protein
MKSTPNMAMQDRHNFNSLLPQLVQILKRKLLYPSFLYQEASIKYFKYYICVSAPLTILGRAKRYRTAG